MKIHGVKLENFMLFDRLDAEFSPNINIICGENSTGKTALMKLLYACAKTVREGNRKRMDQSRDREDGFYTLVPTNVYWQNALYKKLRNLFLPGFGGIASLSKFYSDHPAQGTVDFGGEKPFSFSLASDSLGAPPDGEFQIPHLPPSASPSAAMVYIPPKEMISSTKGFSSLYEEYQIPFDETYYDLTRLLDRPIKRELPPALEYTVREMETLIGGKVLQKDGEFFLIRNDGTELPMSLVSEGYRKPASLLYLISVGCLLDGAILFWDEPETNMNPRMVEPLVKAVLTLAGAGVQVLVTTHDYFVQQYFGLAAKFGDRYQAGAGDLEYRFLSLSKEVLPDGDGKIQLESGSRLLSLKHNAVREEFDEVYDKEMGLIYDD